MKPFSDMSPAEKAAWFAKARSGAQRWAAPPEEFLGERWRPTLGGRLVRPDDMPEHGYLTRKDAESAAKEFKNGCTRFSSRG